MVYAELLNKFRWSVASTAAAQGWNYTYNDSLALASVFAGDAIKLMKAKDEKPDLRLDAAFVREVIRT